MARLSGGMLFKVLQAEGLILLVFGVINLLFVPQTILLSLGFLGLGLVLLIAGTVARLASLGQWISSARSRFALYSLLYTLLVLAGLGLVNFLSARHFNHSWDLTGAQVNTLSARTDEVLGKLDAPVQVLAFFPDSDPYKPDAQRVLGLYERASEQVQVRFIDPIRNPLLARQYGLDEHTGLAVLYNDSRHVLEQPDEAQITNAILNVTQGERGAVYFLQGHGEAPLQRPAEQTQQQRSMQSAADRLRNENYQVAPLDLLTAGDVPSDARALVIAGPTQQLAQSELRAISDYLSGGGRLLTMLEPMIISGLEPLLSDYGVDLPDCVIIEESLRLFQGPTLGIEFIATDAASHAITSKVRDGVVFVLARAVIPKQTKPESTYVTALISSGKSSWAETDLVALMQQQQIELGELDLAGPVSLAAAIERLQPGGAQTRIVVVGDSDFAGDELITLGRDNASLFVNALSWLCESEPIEVIPNRYQSSAFMLQPAQAGLLFYAIVFVIPQLLTLLGIALIGVRRLSR
ncbi:MAG: GldG family protein [Candidatus Alcyoniella australis]|nr:GldG family protein [Candidatus Alcyoniella australis]